MKNLEGGFTLTALLDGTTINGLLRVEGLPLVQRYIKGTNKYIPDFTKVQPEERPTIVVILRDSTTGRVLTPVASSYTWRYNGAILTFDASGSCNNEGMLGMFQKIDDYPAQMGATKIPLPALRVMKNFVSVANVDNDRISISGKVEVNGRQIDFKELDKTVVIQEATGNAYDVVISDDKGASLTEENESMNVTATLYKDGVAVTDYQGYSFAWVKLAGTSESSWKSGRTIVVTNADIDNVLMLRCDISYGSEIVGSGVAQLTDFSDPLYVDFSITGQGVVGNALRRGQSATITPIARKRKDGSIDGRFKEWTFYLQDNQGANFSLPSKGSHTFKAENVLITSADLELAGGGISGAVTSKS